MDTNNFWDALDTLVATSDIIIDRPRGSLHPRYPDVRYPLDYGYLQGTSSGDGAGIDVWIGSLPDRTVEALIRTVDLKKRDTEIKLLLGCTPEKVQPILAFHQRFSNDGGQSAMLIERAATQ
ncbi:MAG: inorganic pyrophosphatase [Chloroflexota bacterium]|nr:inorganic pyrophosphatase [Chloroflexota bacterium]